MSFMQNNQLLIVIVITVFIIIVAGLFIKQDAKKSECDDKKYLILIGIIVAIWFIPTLERETQKDTLNLTETALENALLALNKTTDEFVKYADNAKSEINQSKNKLVNAMNTAHNEISETGKPAMERLDGKENLGSKVKTNKIKEEIKCPREMNNKECETYLRGYSECKKEKH